MSTALAIAGASIFLLLGLAHAVFTFQSTPERGPMMPTNPVISEAMQIPCGLGLAPDIRTTLYRAWIGFNLSHSLGVITVAGVLIAQIATDFGAAVDEVWFLVLVAAAPLVYLMLAIKFWFDQPRNAIALATALVWVGVVWELTAN